MRILQITSDLDGGGVDRLLYDYCSRMAQDIQFDFVVTSKREGILEQPLKDIGCKIYRVAQIKEGLKKHNEQIKNILENNQYDIIHDHSGYKAWCNLRIAKKCKIPVRIAHSHQAFMVETLRQKTERIISLPITKMYATELFACGNDAAKWMWGERTCKKNNVYVMKNAISANCFDFSPVMRASVRSKLNLSDKFVIGNVARFSYQKNHEFLIKVFYEIKKIRKDAVLMLIGRGELEDSTKQLVEKYNLSDSVLFMGVRNDVPDLLNAMDVFVLPSRFEGLPVTLIEVQANGLPAVISDSVTKEMAFSDNLNFIPLSKTPVEWAKVISDKGRADSENLIENTEYDLRVATEELLQKYLSMK